MGKIEKTLSAAQGGISPLMGRIERMEMETPSNSPLMGRIERMVAEMCPEGVKWVKLGEVGMNLDRRRKPITASNRVSGVIPYYGASGIVDYVKDYIFNEDILLISEDGANLLSRTYPIAFSVQGKCWVNNHAHVMSFSNTSTRKYVEHYLNSIDLSPWIAAGAQPKLTKESLNNIEIPLPPLPIQEAITDILDKFDRLSAELQAELQARKQQYEYYRNQLLTRFAPDQPVTEYSLGELCTSISSGKCKSKNSEGCYAVYGSTGIIARTDTPMYNCEQILVARVGANAGAVQIASGKYDVTDNALIVKLKDVINRKYIFYLLQNQNLNQYAVGGGQPLITGAFLKDLRIKVPSLSEQARIVSILDKFEALVNDLSQGLPAEIAAVKEQYEYYRNKLLTFDKKS